jgi:tetratricopeptide (TPR) repeat protein
MSDSAEPLFDLKAAQSWLSMNRRQIAAQQADATISRLLFERAQILFLLGDNDIALPTCERAADLSRNRQETSRIHALISRIWLEEEMQELALWWAMSSVDCDPESAESHFVLGQAQAAGDFNGLAIASFRKVLELEPRHQAAQLALGVNLYQASHHSFAEAIDVLTAYVDDWPADSEGWYELARAISLASVFPQWNLEDADPLFRRARTCAGYEKHDYQIHCSLREHDETEAQRAAAALLPEKEELEHLEPQAVAVYARRSAWRVHPLLACVGEEATPAYRKRVVEGVLPRRFLSGNVITGLVMTVYRHAKQARKEAEAATIDLYNLTEEAEHAADAALYTARRYLENSLSPEDCEAALLELAQATRNDFQMLHHCDIEELEHDRDSCARHGIWQGTPPAWYQSAREHFQQTQAAWKSELSTLSE